MLLFVNGITLYGWTLNDKTNMPQISGINKKLFLQKETIRYEVLIPDRFFLSLSKLVFIR